MPLKATTTAKKSIQDYYWEILYCHVTSNFLSRCDVALISYTCARHNKLVKVAKENKSKLKIYRTSMHFSFESDKDGLRLL